MRQSLIACLALLLAAAAHAGEPLRGPQGLTPLEVTVRATGDRPLACAAALAHWYAADLGRIDPGASLAIALWRDPASGAVYRLNAIGDRMPVERAWCGVEGHSWATRAVLPLERIAGSAAVALALVCEAAGDRVLCTAS